MSKVLCVSYLEKGNKIPTIKKIDADISELNNNENFKWISQALKNGVGPMGIELEPCAWHSGACHKTGDINNINLCYTDNAPDFGIWTTNYNVIDTCHLKEKFDKQIKTDFSRRMFKLIDELPNQYVQCESLNKDFIKMVEDKTIVKNQIDILEKKINASESVQNPEYIKLKEMEKICMEVYDKRKASMTSTYYTLKDKEISLEIFLEKQLVEETIKLNKSRESLNNWYNSNMNKDKTRDLNQLHLLKTKFKNLEAEIKKSFATPFAYIYKIYKDLTELENFYVNENLKNRAYSLEKIQEDISWCKINLDLYKEFLGNETPEEIVSRVDREQLKAAQDEKFIKSNKSIHKITPAATTYVVLPDGSIKTIEIKNQKIIGKTIDVSNEWRLPNNDKWSKVRGN